MPKHVLAPVYEGVQVDKFTRLKLQVWAIPEDLVLHLCGRTFLANGETSMLCFDYNITGLGVRDDFYVVPSPGLLTGINVYIVDGFSAYGDVFVQLSVLHGFSENDMAHRLLILGNLGGDVMRAYPCSPCDGA